MSKIIIDRSKNKGKSILSVGKLLRSIDYFKSIDEVYQFLQKYLEDEKVTIQLNSENRETIIDFITDLEFNYIIE